MRHAGIGWPNGQHPEDLWAIPGSTFVMLDSEARFHYANLRRGRPEALILWRSIGTPPAVVDYDPKRYAESLLRHWDEQEHWGIEHFVVGNEFDLNYERGDTEDDWSWSNMEAVYSKYAEFLPEVALILRDEFHRRGQDVMLHFPAWAPGHHLREYLDLWKPAVDHFDVLDVHAYGPTDQIAAELDWYSDTFPNKPIVLTEWHGRDRADYSERRTLMHLEQRYRHDPNFWGAAFFIWRWCLGKDSTDEWDIEGNSRREALFWYPPTAQEVICEPSTE